MPHTQLSVAQATKRLVTKTHNGQRTARPRWSPADTLLPPEQSQSDREHGTITARQHLHLSRPRWGLGKKPAPRTPVAGRTGAPGRNVPPGPCCLCSQQGPAFPGGRTGHRLSALSPWTAKDLPSAGGDRRKETVAWSRPLLAERYSGRKGLERPPVGLKGATHGEGPRSLSFWAVALPSPPYPGWTQHGHCTPAALGPCPTGRSSSPRAGGHSPPTPKSTCPLLSQRRHSCTPKARHGLLCVCCHQAVPLGDRPL